MKKSDFKDNVYCISGQGMAVCLHEIFFGHGMRDLCIKYNVQAPVSYSEHLKAHANKSAYIAKYCKIFNLDMYQIHVDLQTHKHSYKAQERMKKVAIDMKQKLLEFQKPPQERALS